jgi:hypothetical protein
VNQLLTPSVIALAAKSTADLNTMLFKAAEEGEMKQTKETLATSADVKITNHLAFGELQKTSLRFAVEKGHDAVCKTADGIKRQRQCQELLW